MLNLVFVETALELVPSSLIGHPAVKRNAKRRGKKQIESLLDRSLHHHAMNRLDAQEKRGRPDIIHLCLLLALGSPLNRRGQLNVWVNTLHGYTITVNPETRIPRNYNQFTSLIEQLYKTGKVPPLEDFTLLLLERKKLSELKQEIKPTKTIALSSHGEKISLNKLVTTLVETDNPLVFLGAYPKGPMEKATLDQVDQVFSIHDSVLEAWTVTSRLIYEYESIS